MARKLSNSPTAVRKRRERDRENKGRKPLITDPRWALLCDALKVFARVSEIDPRHPALAKAIRAIQTLPGWEDDSELLSTIVTAIVDEWAKHWARSE
ncbi:hypothetical protein ACSHT2_13965 [Bradyrhizobium sp. PUT101]|uniref:hypothetical protein n=1 Tax=Bradyrhizobium sp. PUT101 TaxID=3447427 RepID=UPI003F8472DA